MFYDRAGIEIDSDERDRLSAISDYKQVALVTLPNGVTVSTVWVGNNYQFEDGPPLIFETMVFGGPFHLRQFRWSTQAEALHGHDQLAARVRDAEDLLSLSFEDLPVIDGESE
jgi:hypothetical protein